MNKAKLLDYFERKENMKKQFEIKRPQRERLVIDEACRCVVEINGLNYEFSLQVRQLNKKADQIDHLSAAQKILAWSLQDPNLQGWLSGYRIRVKNQLGLALQQLVIGLLIDEISSEQGLIESLVEKLAQHNVQIVLDPSA